MKREQVNTLILSAFIFSLITFIITPFTGDLFVLFAGSRQADLLGGGVSNALIQWDLKGAFYRLFLYVIYKIVNPCVNMLGAGLTYCTAVNALFCVFVLTAIAFSVIVATGATKILVISAICTAIFASLPQTHIQAEMVSTVILVIAFSCYINAQRTNHFFRTKLFLSGFIAASIMFFKSLFALMAFPFMAGIFLWNRKNNHKLRFRESLVIFTGGLTMMLLAMALILCVNPHEIQNMLDAAIWQPSVIQSVLGGTILHSLSSFIKNFAYSALVIPAILFGMLCAVLNSVSDIRRKDYSAFLLRLSLWSVPALVVIIADKYFIYHYFMFVPVSILEICLTQSRINRALALTAIISAAFYLCFMSPFSTYVSESAKLTEETYRESKQTLSSLKIDPSETVMYLDDGFGAYLIGNRSYLDEYYALPLQRVNEESGYASHVKALEKALRFNRRYITVYSSWFYGKGNNQKLRDKISKEYRKVGSLSMYTFDISVFRRPSREKVIRVIDIYERVK